MKNNRRKLSDIFREPFIRLFLRPPLLAFLIITNVIVTFMTTEQRGLWYTPLTTTIFILLIIYTVKKYGYKDRVRKYRV